jgi:hypothetical protein
MEQSPCEADSQSSGQEIAFPLCSLEAHYHVHDILPLDPIWIQSTYKHTLSLRSVLLLSFHQHPGFQSGLFPSGFLTKLQFVVCISTTHFTCPANLILIKLFILIIFVEEHKLRSLSFCFLLPADISCTSGIGTLFSNSLSLCCSHRERDQVS